MDATLAEIARWIAEYLWSWESDQYINANRTYHNPGAFRESSRVKVWYHCPGSEYMLTRSEAIDYLKRIQSGYVGRHWE